MPSKVDREAVRMVSSEWWRRGIRVMTIGERYWPFSFWYAQLVTRTESTLRRRATLVGSVSLARASSNSWCIRETVFPSFLERDKNVTAVPLSSAIERYCFDPSMNEQKVPAAAERSFGEGESFIKEKSDAFFGFGESGM